MQRPLSHEYQSKLSPIKIEGVVGQVWDPGLLLSFLKSRESDHYAILGGDVIRVLGDKMEYTYDNWSVAERRRVTESFRDFAARCKVRAIEYVSSYPIKENIVFSLTMSSEETAGL